MTTAEVQQRTLPHNLEAERSVLGAILIENKAIDVAAGIIKPADMFRDAHRRIYKAMLELSDERQEIDLVTLKARLEQKNDLEEVGGPAYMSSLVDGVPRSTNVLYYADIIKDKAQLRNLIFSANKILGRAYEAEDHSKTITAWAEQQIFDVANEHVESNMQDLRRTAGVLMEDLDFRVKHRGQVTGVDTGFQSLNEQTLGWQRGNLIFVGARPSIGKTTFVMNSVVRAAIAKNKAAVFSMEMRRKQLEYRMLSSISQVPLTRMLAGAIGGSDYAKINDAFEVMHDLPIYIDDRRARTVWDIRSACRRLKAEQGLDLVVVDYVQLMRGTLERRNASRNEELTDISNRFQALAGELEVALIVLSQLARRSVDRPDPRPKMSDLKDCGAFEQDADDVVLLHRKNHREGGVTNVIFEKQRNGPTGTLNITLDRDTVTFVDGGDEPPPEPKVEKPKKQRKAPATSTLTY